MPSHPAQLVAPTPHPDLDEHAAERPWLSHQDPLPLDWPRGALPSAPGGRAAASPRLLVVASSSTEAPSPTAGASSELNLPSPVEWVARLARAIVEVVAGQRPPAQLSRWTSPEVYADLTRRGACAARHPATRHAPPVLRRVLSVRACGVAPGVVEAAAVVSGRERSRAVAIRIEIVNQRWVATAVELG